jgi:hypothetical protein
METPVAAGLIPVETRDAEIPVEVMAVGAAAISVIRPCQFGPAGLFKLRRLRGLRQNPRLFAGQFSGACGLQDAKA